MPDDERQWNRRAGDSQEAIRLADQRVADLAQAAAMEVARAREQGRREAEDAVLQSETRAHFALINGSIERTALALDELLNQFNTLKADLQERDAVNAALVEANARQGAKKLSRLQTIFMVIAGVIAAVSLLIAVIQALA